MNLDIKKLEKEVAKILKDYEEIAKKKDWMLDVWCKKKFNLESNVHARLHCLICGKSYSNLHALFNHLQECESKVRILNIEIILNER